MSRGKIKKAAKTTKNSAYFLVFLIPGFFWKGIRFCFTQNLQFCESQLLHYHFFSQICLELQNAGGNIQDGINKCSTNSSNLLPNYLIDQHLVSKYMFLRPLISFLALPWLCKQFLIDFAVLPKSIY